MKAFLKFIGGVTLLYLLPLLLLSGLAGWIATAFIEIKWNIASFIAFLFILFLLQTWEVVGGVIYGVLKKLKSRKIHQPEK